MEGPPVLLFTLFSNHVEKHMLHKIDLICQSTINGAIKTEKVKTCCLLKQYRMAA